MFVREISSTIFGAPFCRTLREAVATPHLYVSPTHLPPRAPSQNKLQKSTIRSTTRFLCWECRTSLPGWTDRSTHHHPNMSSFKKSSGSTPRIHISVPPRRPSAPMASATTATTTTTIQGRHSTMEPSNCTSRDHEPLSSCHPVPLRTPTTKHRSSARSSDLWDGLRQRSLDFPINTECK